jgi:hypothetical protein
MVSCSNGEYGVLLFDSTQRAVRAEKVLKAAGHTVKLIPVPRQLSSDCGVCLRFCWEERAGVEATLSGVGLETAGVHAI